MQDGMVIFNIFAGFVLLIITIRVFLLLKNKEAGDEKFTKAVDLLIAMALVSASWVTIYALFGYKKSPNGKAPIENQQIEKTNEERKSPVLFQEDVKK